MKQIILCICLFIAVLTSASAQLTTLKEYKDTYENYMHDFLKPGPGEYALLEYEEPRSLLQFKKNPGNARYFVYDQNFNVKYSAQVEGLKGKNFLCSFEGESPVQFVYQDKDQVFSSPFDYKTGQLTGSPTRLYKTSDKPEGFLNGYSVDSNYKYAISLYSIYKDKVQVLDGVITDIKKNTNQQFSVKLEGLAYTFETMNVYQTAEGTLLIVSSVRLETSKKRYMPLLWLITEVDNKGQSVTNYLKDLPEGRIENMVWNLTKEGISFTGLLSKSSKKGYQYIVSGDYNIWRKEVINVRETSFLDAPFWAKVTSKKWLESKDDGLPISKMVNSFVAPDGTKYIVMQGFAYYKYSSRYEQNSEGLSIFALSIAPDQTVNWIKHIPVHHVEGVIQTYTGSLAIFDNSKGLYIFFNDEDRSDNAYGNLRINDLQASWEKDRNTYVVNIKPDGTFTRAVAGQYMDLDYHLAITQPYKLYKNEFLFTSYRFRVIKKDSYKPAVFIIK